MWWYAHNLNTISGALNNMTEELMPQYNQQTEES